MGASAASFLPATTTMKSVESEKEWMAAERNVRPEDGCPAADGGQASRALSVPMRKDSPAARITPAKLGARDMKSFDCRFRLSIGNQVRAIGNQKRGMQIRCSFRRLPAVLQPYPTPGLISYRRLRLCL